MAQFTFSNNTYAGSDLAGFMASTLLEGDSVTRGLLTVITDVKARKILLDADDNVVLQNPSGVFTDQGTTATQNEYNKLSTGVFFLTSAASSKNVW